MSLGEYNGVGSGTTKLLLHLNGNSNDSSGNSNNGSDTNITYSQVNSKFGKCAGFNGNGIITTPSSVYMSATQFLLSIWVKTISSGTGSGMLISSSNNDGSIISYRLRYNKNTQTVQFIRNDNSGNIVTNITSSITINDGKWHNIIATLNTSIGSKIYIDGTERASDSITTQNNITSLSTAIGGAQYGGDYFTGEIDEVIIENVAWSQEKIKKYYTMTKGRFGII